MNTTKLALIQFLDTAVSKGRMNKNTGASTKAACTRILEQVGPDDDVQEVDISAEVIQYNNRHPNELSPESLRVYENRVKSVVGLFVQSVVDPTGFKFPSKSNGNRPGSRVQKRTPPSVAASDAPKEGGPQTSHSALRNTATETSLALSFPLRPNFLAQVVVPRDLSKDEGKRLCAFIDALAHDRTD